MLANGVRALAFGPQGELLSAGRDNQARLWDASGASVKSLSSGSILPLQITITFDGKGLFAGGANGVVRFLLGNDGRSR